MGNDFRNLIGKIVIYRRADHPQNTSIGRLIAESNNFVKMEFKTGKEHYINKSVILELYEMSQKEINETAE